MFYMRGHSRDFDHWRSLGCTGWGYEEVLPYFIRMENSWRGAGPYPGDSGPLPVRAISTEKPLHGPLMQTAAAAGFNVSDDLHAQGQEGFARGEVNIDARGRRASTSRAYLHPVLGRANLTVEMNALTTRVLFEKSRAVGVEYVHERSGGAAAARRSRRSSCVVAAITPRSCCWLSGIGPAGAAAQSWHRATG